MIAPAKLSDYLLRPREDHDKAGFLRLAGYHRDDPARLEADIRAQLLPLPASFTGSTAYGDKFVIRGELIGPNGRKLRVCSVWMVEKPAGTTKFVTLYPDHS
jgi:hypothetical protein